MKNFIQQFYQGFLLKFAPMRICPNAYYNYRKHRKADYYAQKAGGQGKIDEIYHRHNGVDGYRTMTAYLEREGYNYHP